MIYPQKKTDTEFTIPNTVVTIDGTAMDGNNSYIASLTIPASVRNIGWSSIGGRNLKTIKALGTTPATVSQYGFSIGSISTCTLYVPIGSKSAYQAATGWKDFVNIVESSY